jgi:3-isopropylmalate dehydratase small subunit
VQAFTTLRSVAVPMADADIDTDIIFPARFLTLTQKTGLARYAFFDRRFDAAGRERPDFVLHRAPWRGAQILVAGANFGCGSSREQAPWALADLGLRCIIAPGFGDIFEANCLRNGLLPIRMPGPAHAELLADAGNGGELLVDLAAQTIARDNGAVLAFSLPQAQRTALLAGLDDIELLLRAEGPRIAAFQAAQQLRMPWLYDTPP